MISDKMDCINGCMVISDLVIYLVPYKKDKNGLWNGGLKKDHCPTPKKKWIIRKNAIENF